MFKQVKKAIVIALATAALWISSAYAGELSDWAVDDFRNANSAQLIPFSVGARSMCGNITREQLCELIVNLYEGITNEKLADYPSNPFTDCNNKTIINAYGSGLVGGTGNNTFSPNQLVTRQEMAKMLNNMLTALNINIKLADSEDLHKSGYPDVNAVSDWAQSAMATMLDYSLMNGVEGKLMPAGNATREQAIVAVSRAYETFKSSSANEIKEVLYVTSPTELQSLAGQNVTVTWNGISDAESYSVFIRNSNGELIVNDNVGKSTSHTIVKSMFKNGAYNVSIQATIPNGKTVYSVPVGFYFTELSEEESMMNTFSEIPDSLFEKNFGMTKQEAINEALHIVTEPTEKEIKQQQQQTQTLDNIYPEVTVPSISDGTKVGSIFAEAEKYLGVPYLYGGTTPAGFDCSGFVQYVFKKNGISLKRTSRDQYSNNGVSVPKSQLQRGDLVFFGSNGVVGHVGIYAGNGTMIHSPSTGKTITYTSIESDYYKSHYIGAKRVIN